MPENEEVAKATVAQQDVAKAIGTKAEAAATATAGDELSEEDLEAVAGGITRDGKGGLITGLNG